jgi:hypothetical protein
MESYSQRRFTFSKDRFRAMAGIVQYYQAATGDVAVLGLWEGSLHQDLLWMRIRKLPDKEDFTPHLSNIPSWSWLSLSDDDHMTRGIALTDSACYCLISRSLDH